MNKIFQTVKVLVLALALSFGLSFVYAWTAPMVTPPGGNVSAPINTSATPQTKTGDLTLAGNFCLGGVCKTVWPDMPLSDRTEFVAGHDYPYGGYTYPYIKGASYYYPYITLSNAIDLIGISSDPLATNWFTMGYSYYQPWGDENKALYVEEGDNSSPSNIYSNSTGIRNNTGDFFMFCTYADPSQRFDYSETGCSQRKAQGVNINYYFADSQSNTKGSVRLEVRLVAAQSGCNNVNYLPYMSLASWGSPEVVNLRITSYQKPNVVGDNCNGANTHSRIEGRFIVNTSYGGFTPDPIMNFKGLGLTWMVKSLGIASLKFI